MYLCDLTNSKKKKKNDKKVGEMGGNDENWCGKWGGYGGEFGLWDCDKRFFAIMMICKAMICDDLLRIFKNIDCKG